MSKPATPKPSTRPKPPSVNERAGRRAILVLNGPNLNLLGTREPEIYGRETLEDINRRLDKVARASDARVDCYQSNHEGELIERVHAARGRYAFIIINPGGFTHTSVALRDALTGVAIPFIEVHISNVQAREAFRRHSYLSDVARGTISGLGSFGYEAALLYALN